MAGIYQLNDKKLIYCWARPRKPRPTEFTVAEGSGHTLVTLERFSTGEGEVEERLLDAGVYFRKDEIGWITEVRIVGKSNTEEILEWVSKLKNLKKLRADGVTDGGLGFVSVHDQLDTLEISGDGISDSGLSSIGALQQISTLGIHGKVLTDECLDHLSDFKKLASLRLSETGISMSGLRKLRPLPTLYKLDLHGTDITDTVLAEMVGAFPSLSSLNLANAKISDNGLNTLSALENLTWVRLSHTEISDVGLSYLSESTKVRQLYLNGTNVTDHGIKQLAGMSQLTVLDLSNTSITNRGLKVVANSFPNLRELKAKNLRGLTREGLLELCNLKQLHWLRISAGVIDSDAATELEMRSSSNLRIIQD